MGSKDFQVDRDSDWRAEHLVATTELAAILEKVARTFYAWRPRGPSRDNFAEFEAKLNSWADSAPAFLLVPKPQSLVHPFRSQAIQLRLTYSYIRLMVQRPLGRNIDLNECISALSEILAIMEKLSTDSSAFPCSW